MAKKLPRSLRSVPRCNMGRFAIFSMEPKVLSAVFAKIKDRDFAANAIPYGKVQLQPGTPSIYWCLYGRLNDKDIWSDA